MTLDDRIYCQRCGGDTELRLNEGRQRPVCVECGAVTYFDPKLAVAVIIEMHGKLLLGRRAPGAREAGRWSFPAGFVERGEVVESAAAREVEEEVGLTVKIGELLGLYSYKGEDVALAVYVAERFEGIPKARDDLDSVGWFAIEDLPDLAFPHDRQIIEAWAVSRPHQNETGQSGSNQ